MYSVGAIRNTVQLYSFFTLQHFQITEQCSELQDPANGNVKLVTGRTGKTFGDVVNYTCYKEDDEFEVVGERIRTCRKGGIWDPVDAPTCERTYGFISLQLKYEAIIM